MSSVGVTPVEQLASMDPPDGACVNYDECGNVPPGMAEMCAECLDEVRHNDSLS